MRKSITPTLAQLLKLVKSFEVNLTPTAATCSSARAAERTLQHRLIHPSAQGFQPSSLRPYTALPWPELTDEDFWEDRSHQPALQTQSETAQPGSNQELSEAHHQLWAQLSNLRDQGILIQAERRERGKPATAYPFAPISAYLESLHGQEDGGFDDTMLDLWARQVQTEMKAAQHAFDTYMTDTKEKRQSGAGSGLHFMRHFLRRWHPLLVKAVEEEQQEVLAGVTGQDRFNYGALLLLLTPEVLAATTLQTVMDLFLTGNSMDLGWVKQANLFHNIGKAVRQNVVIAQIKSKWKQEQKRRRKVRTVLKNAPEGQAKQSELEILTERLRQLGEDMSEMDDKWLEENDTFEDRMEAVRYGWMGKKRESGEMQFQIIQKKDTGKLQGAGKHWQKRAMLRAMENAMNWDKEVLFKIGAAMVKLLLESVTFQKRPKGLGPDGEQLPHETAPVFRFENLRGTLHNNGPKVLGVIMMAPEILDRIERSHYAKAAMAEIKYLPMLVPPAPWVNPQSGGHVLTPACIIRGHEAKYGVMEHVLEAARYQCMPQAYDALNYLGNISWRINSQALEAVTLAWDRGGTTGGLMKRHPDPLAIHPRTSLTTVHSLNLMTVVSSSPSLLPMNLAALAVTGRKLEGVNRRMEAAWQKVASEQHALKCDMEIKLKVARDYVKEERFWYPHTIDFRGRAYPMHANLQHLSDDPCRCLLEFADGQPLGPRGLYWLFVHASNLAGIDKVSLEDRYKWTSDNLSAILDSADDPFGMDGDGFGKLWTSASTPWQFLTACFDIRNALASGKPETYVSHLPIHQDGTCNGLQHYAALGRDAEGGSAVNLTPADKPQDIYSRVARLVAASVERDAENGKALAKGVVGTIDRKLVKQTVMTSVYGVTFLGAKEQIANRLYERDWSKNDNLIQLTSLYLASVTLRELGNMFESSKTIMTWLRNVAKVVSDDGHALAWTNPLGIPVSQPYRKEGKKEIWTAMARTNMELGPRMKDPVDKAKQRNAFPPNFVHSLDASHMMLTALGCKDHGLSFAGVHDSYWTHASSVDTMNKMLREKFVELHSRPLLEELKAELEKRHPNLEFPEPPPPLSNERQFDLGLVKQSDYFFS